MDIGSILLILSIFLLVAMFVFRPFFTYNSETAGLDNRLDEEKRLQDHQYSAILAEKDRLLNTLQELEIDHGIGKIPEEDYPILRADLLTAGARILRKLDEIEEQMQKNSTEDAAEIQVVKLETEEILPTSTGGMDPIEEMVTTRRRLREEKSAGFCPHCGKVIQKSDVYCPRCGSKVAV